MIFKWTKQGQFYVIEKSPNISNIISYDNSFCEITYFRAFDILSKSPSKDKSKYTNHPMLWQFLSVSHLFSCNRYIFSFFKITFLRQVQIYQPSFAMTIPSVKSPMFVQSIFFFVFQNHLPKTSPSIPTILW